MTLIQDPPSRTGHVPAGVGGLGAGPAGPRAADATRLLSWLAVQQSLRLLGPGGGASSEPAAPPTAPSIGRPSGRPSVLRFTDSMDRAMDELVDARLWSLSDAELGEALVGLTREQARLAELRLRVLAEADARKVGHELGASSTPAWLAHETKQTTQGVFADLRLAQALEEEFTLTRAAMAGRLVPAAPEAADVAGVEQARPGVVDAEKARVIVRAVQGLVEDHGDLVTPEVRRRAEAHLVDLAARFDAVTLRKLAKRLIEVVCPEAADAAEGNKLDAEEKAARRKAFVSIRDHGDGTSTGTFTIPTLHADLFRKVLDELTSPGKLGEERLDPETGRPLSTSTLRGRGFLTLLENHLNLDTLPGSGGSPFTLVINVYLEVLETGIGAAAVETGHRISAGEARRLACKAGIIPMVLDGASVPLDLGRERRLFTKHQRIAMDHTYGGCAADGCDLPPSRVEYHHTKPWHKGGKTDLKDGLPFCPPHHHMADHPEHWDMRQLPTGGIRFTRRQ